MYSSLQEIQDSFIQRYLFLLNIQINHYNNLLLWEHNINFARYNKKYSKIYNYEFN